MKKRIIAICATILFLPSCGGDSPKQSTPNTKTPAQATTQNVKKSSEQALLIHLKLSDGKFGTNAERDACFALETELEKDIEKAGVGEFDGNEFGEGECVFFIYGADADKLFNTIETRLKSSSLSKGGWAIKRYGPASDKNVKETRIDF